MASTTPEDRLGPRAKNALRAIRSSSSPAALAENSADSLMASSSFSYEERERFLAEPTTAAAERVALSPAELSAVVSVSVRDVERRIAECVVYVLEDFELSPEARIHQATEMLQALTGGMKPRR